MSNPSKYSGLAGTILLGTLLGLNYTQYARRKSPLSEKGAAFDPTHEAATGSLFESDGKVVPFGKTNIPGSEAVNRIRGLIPDTSPLVVCTVLSGMWAIRTFGAMNRVLNRRYSDVVYQIRRPDVIANRLTAWKYLGLGGVVVPAFAAGYFLHSKGNGGFSFDKDGTLPSILRDLTGQSQRLGKMSPLFIERSQLTASVAEFTRTLRDGFKP